MSEFEIKSSLQVHDQTDTKDLLLIFISISVREQCAKGMIKVNTFDYA